MRQRAIASGQCILCVCWWRWGQGHPCGRSGPRTPATSRTQPHHQLPTHLCTTSSLRRSRCDPRRPPPMPKRSKMSAAPPPPPPPPMPSLTASSPNCTRVGRGSAAVGGSLAVSRQNVARVLPGNAPLSRGMQDEGGGGGTRLVVDFALLGVPQAVVRLIHLLELLLIAACSSTHVCSASAAPEQEHPQRRRPGTRAAAGQHPRLAHSERQPRMSTFVRMQLQCGFPARGSEHAEGLDAVCRRLCCRRLLKHAVALISGPGDRH